MPTIQLHHVCHNPSYTATQWQSYSLFTTCLHPLLTQLVPHAYATLPWHNPVLCRSPAPLSTGLLHILDDLTKSAFLHNPSPGNTISLADDLTDLHRHDAVFPYIHQIFQKYMNHTAQAASTSFNVTLIPHYHYLINSWTLLFLAFLLCLFLRWRCNRPPSIHRRNSWHISSVVP